MRSKRRKPVYYSITSMNDGAVLSARPIRKLSEKQLKRGRQRIDADFVCDDYMGSYVGSFPADDEGRLRFFNIMANRLNTRRAIRELILPVLDGMRQEIGRLQGQVNRLEAASTGKNP